MLFQQSVTLLHLGRSGSSAQTDVSAAAPGRLAVDICSVGCYRGAPAVIFWGWLGQTIYCGLVAGHYSGPCCVICITVHYNAVTHAGHCGGSHVRMSAMLVLLDCAPCTEAMAWLPSSPAAVKFNNNSCCQRPQVLACCVCEGHLSGGVLQAHIMEL